MMYKIYGVSGDMLHLICAYSYCIPLKSELLLTQCTFLTNCCEVNNSALQFIMNVLDVEIYAIAC